MSKTRIIVGLAVLTCAIAATTTPANAIFRSNNGTQSGPIVTFPTTTTFTAANGASSVQVICVNTGAVKATGFWTIQLSKETIVGEEQTQEVSIEGPHEDLVIQKWGECTLTSGEAKLAASVSECILQVIQQTKSTAANQVMFGSVQRKCEVKVPAAGCTLVIPQTKINHFLLSVLGSNSGVNGVELKSNVKGIYYKASAGCVGVSGERSEGSFKTGTNGGEAIVTGGQKLI